MTDGHADSGRRIKVAPNGPYVVSGVVPPPVVASCAPSTASP